MLSSLWTMFSRWFTSSERPASSQMLLWVLRGCFGAVVIGLALVAFRHFNVGVIQGDHVLQDGEISSRPGWLSL